VQISFSGSGQSGQFESLEQVLGKVKSGRSTEDHLEFLNDHVQSVFDCLLEHFPDEALFRVEEASYLLRNKDTHHINEWLSIDGSREYYAKSAEVRTDFYRQQELLFGRKKKRVTFEDGEAEPE